MVALARKSLVHEWRRFLPAVLAIAFSGLLLLVQAALVAGIFGTAAVQVEASAGELWAGRPGTPSVEQGRPLAPDTEVRLRADPGVHRVEPLRLVDGDWRAGEGRGAATVVVVGIATDADALAYARVLPPALRTRLAEPDAVVVDRADLERLGVGVGDRARINGQGVRVVGAARGLRSLGGANVLASLDLSVRLQPPPRDSRATYYLVRLAAGADAQAVRARLEAAGAGRGFAVWPAQALSHASSMYWLLDTGAGVGVLFLALVVALAGAVITAQTLATVVAGTAAEYATLHALGVGLGALQRVVLEQAAWIGACGLVVAGLATTLALALARLHDVPVSLGPAAVAACSLGVMAMALIAGVLSLRSLRRADPALLLR